MVVGPTSAAMVIASSKGAITPLTTANLAVANGYRTANSGTAWAFFPFIADYFDFDEYYTTSNFNTAIDYLKTDKDNDGNSDYYIIASCGSGLFTSGGHYIVLVADKNNTITVYDPYLYEGKFTTASRKVANVTVSGNSVYVTESAFKTYANYKNFWIFSNDRGEGNNNATYTNVATNTTNYSRYVATQSSNLNVRNAPNGSVIDTLSKGSKVTVYEISGNWSRIGTNRWVSTSYLSSSIVTVSSINNNTKNYAIGKYQVATNIHVRTGPGTNYSAKTYKKLTANARAQNKSRGNYYYNGYKKRSNLHNYRNKR